MEIMSLAIAVFAVIIGLVIGYVSISAKMKSSQEAAELMLLNAEQEATNLRGQAEREADLLVNDAKRESKSLKHYWRPKKKPENTVKKWTLNLNQNVKNSNKSKVV